MTGSLSLSVLVSCLSLVGFLVVGTNAAHCAANSTNVLCDVPILNFALGAEHFEAALYAHVLALVDATSNGAPALANSAGSNFNATQVYEFLQVIGGQEASHATLLTSAITGICNGTADCAPVAACAAYNFPNTSYVEALGLLGVVENVGEGAYTGALAGIKNNALRVVGAGILAVEAEHAAVLNFLTNTNPFPDLLVSPLSAEQVFCAVKPFIAPSALASCAPWNSYVNVSCDNVTVAAPPTPDQSQLLADVPILNFALGAEHFESALYAFVVQSFPAPASAQEIITNANGNSFNASQVYAYLQHIGAQEAAHATLLTGVIGNICGAESCTAVNACSAYTFPNVTYMAALDLLGVVENVGEGAYIGALGGLTAPSLREAAAGILAVEAEHAAVLSFISGRNPFPDVVVAGLTAEQVFCAVKPFIAQDALASCAPWNNYLGVACEAPSASTADKAPSASTAVEAPSASTADEAPSDSTAGASTGNTGDNNGASTGNTGDSDGAASTGVVDNTNSTDRCNDMCPPLDRCCGDRCYNPLTHDCKEGDYLCPTGHSRCGLHCYVPSEYHCCGAPITGELRQLIHACGDIASNSTDSNLDAMAARSRRSGTNSSSSLSMGVIIFLVVFSVVAAFAALGGIAYYVHKKRAQADREPQQQLALVGNANQQAALNRV